MENSFLKGDDGNPKAVTTFRGEFTFCALEALASSVCQALYDGRGALQSGFHF